MLTSGVGKQFGGAGKRRQRLDEPLKMFEEAKRRLLGALLSMI